MTDYRISQLRPNSDETLMSFLRRVQIDADYSGENLDFLAASTQLPDARLAERRNFDWESLSRFFNATPEEIYSLSERSLFHERGDESRRRSFRQCVPWTQDQGYAAHCPCCLRESEHWRKSWLGPDAIVCEKHNTVMVRHCCGCGGDLSQMTWTNASPICPTCGMHLSLNPAINAPSQIAVYGREIRLRFSRLEARKLIGLRDYELSHFGAIWRAARLFGSEVKELWPLFAAMLSLGEIDVPSTGAQIEAQALRYAQAVIVAYLISEMDPTFTEFFWLSTTNFKALRNADRTVYFKLLKFADSLGVKLSPREPVCCQCMMSFESWVGEKAVPNAA